MIFVGDSHVGVLGFKKTTLAIGAATAWGLLNENSKTQAGKKIIEFINKFPNETVVINLGEVDCRHHIVKQAQIQSRQIKDITKEVVKRYFEFIDRIISLGRKVIVWCPLPNKVYELTDVEKDKHKNFPINGTIEERYEATKFFTRYVVRECKKRNIGYIKLFKTMRDNQNYYKDYVHMNSLGREAFLKQLNKYV